MAKTDETVSEAELATRRCAHHCMNGEIRLTFYQRVIEAWIVATPNGDKDDGCLSLRFHVVLEDGKVAWVEQCSVASGVTYSSTLDSNTPDSVTFTFG